MPTMDTTARGLLMPRLLPLLRLMPMPTMAPTAMVWLTTDTAMVSPITVMATMDTTAMPIPMPTMDTTARGPLMLPPLLMLTITVMATMDTTAMPIPMPTMDT